MKTANLPKTKDFPAGSYLYKKLGGNIRIMLDNDAHTATLAEHRNGARRGFTHMLITRFLKDILLIINYFVGVIIRQEKPNIWLQLILKRKCI